MQNSSGQYKDTTCASLLTKNDPETGIGISYKIFILKDLQNRVIPAKAGIHNTKLTCKRLDP